MCSPALLKCLASNPLLSNPSCFSAAEIIPPCPLISFIRLSASAYLAFLIFLSTPFPNPTQTLSKMYNIFERTESSADLSEGTINMNSNWISSRGSWIIHLALIVLFRFIYSIIPWISTISAWTLTNLSYALFQYILFHGTIGTPFDVNQGEFQDLTTWEQLEIGEQFTPTKKFFFVLPIALFLVSTHYCNYDVPSFFINLTALLIILIAKLPALHRVRFFGINMTHSD